MGDFSPSNFEKGVYGMAGVGRYFKLKEMHVMLAHYDHSSTCNPLLCFDRCALKGMRTSRNVPAREADAIAELKADF